MNFVTAGNSMGSSESKDEGPLDGESRLKIWRAPAYQKARSGTPEFRVASFLRQKGVPNDLAKAAAAELVTEARRELRRQELPKLVLGWGLIAFGAFFSIHTLIKGGGNWIFAIGPMALGIWMLYGRRPL